MADDEQKRLEKRRAANRASYLRNRDKRLAQHKIWREANPERMKELNQQWYRANHEYATQQKRVYREAHREEMRALVSAWYRANRDTIAAATRLKRTGCTPELYQSLLEKQGGVCAICRRESKDKQLAADHCHDTGVVRGLLCFQCNTALGFFEDCPERLQAAITYLARSQP